LSALRVAGIASGCAGPEGAGRMSPAATGGSRRNGIVVTPAAAGAAGPTSPGAASRKTCPTRIRLGFSRLFQPASSR
jgi:hypothetical protein